MTKNNEQQNNEGVFDVISDQIFGEYAIPDFNDRIFSKVYYAIRERYGYTCKGLMGERFNWEDYKNIFTEAFGTSENPKYNLQQMLEYAQRKLGMNVSQLVEANKQSWQRRRAYELQSELKRLESSGVVDLRAKQDARMIF